MRQRWNADELVESWTLDAAEVALVANKAGASRLGFAVLARFFALEGRFPVADEVPVEAVDFVARQVGVDFAVFGSYDWSGRSWKRHRGQIRAHHGFRAWSEQVDADRLVASLIESQVGEGLSFDELVDAAYVWCRRSRVEPPFAGPLRRLVRAADHRWEMAAFDSISSFMTSDLDTRLDELAGEDHARLARLRADPGPVGVKSINAELQRLDLIDSIDVRSELFAGYSARTIDRWHDRFHGSKPSALLAMRPEARRVLTAAWVLRRRGELIDGVVELSIGVVHKIGTKAERRVDREQLADLRRVKGKTNLLFRIAEAALANPDGKVSEVLSPIIDHDGLSDLVREYHAAGPALRSMSNTYARSSYGRHYRRALLAVLARLSLNSSNTTHRPILDGLALIRRHLDETGLVFPANEGLQSASRQPNGPPDRTGARPTTCPPRAARTTRQRRRRPPPGSALTPPAAQR